MGRHVSEGGVMCVVVLFLKILTLEGLESQKEEEASSDEPSVP